MSVMYSYTYMAIFILELNQDVSIFKSFAYNLKADEL